MSLLASWSALPAAHRYTIAVDDELQTMTVEARFDRAIETISARTSEAAKYLRHAHDCESGERLQVHGRTLGLPSAGLRCLRYVTNLDSADRGDAMVVTSPALWLWRPRLRADDEIEARFVLPDAAQVFVPWHMLDDSGRRYRLRASPESGRATAIFGRFQERVESIAGARVRIVLLGDRPGLELPTHIGWIRSTVQNIELAYGRFPNPAVSVVLIPVGSEGRKQGRAVSFGRVVRDGGETVELLINPNVPVADFYTEWTPTHEFSHLMLPYLDRDQRWISEGFAQYYQNILLARAGRYSVPDAWQKLYSGLERGRESAPGLSPNDAAASDERDTRMKVYWSGASLALMADVELRRRSAGRESLDSVLDQLQECCLPSAFAWSGTEFFRKLDEFVEQPLFMDLYREYADASKFPDARPLLGDLGITLIDGEVRLADDAPLAEIREAITN